MQRYENDEYENWDEYEEDGEEGEGAEEGYEEPDQPTHEELEYLELRQKLKELIRKKKMKIDKGTANAGSRDKVHAYPRDNYGSFFGPSRPAIAQRVIEESRSLLENPDLAAKMISKPNRPSNKTSVSAPVRSKSETNHRPSVTSVSRNKAQILKNTRDYSFLLSEDAEVPAPSKSIPPPRNVSARESDARSAQPPPRSKQVVNQRGREVSNGHDERRPRPASSQQRETYKAGSEKMAHAKKLPAEDRRQLGSNNGSGPGRPLGPKGMPSKTVLPPTRMPNQAVAKNTVSRVQKPTPSQTQSVLRKPTTSNSQSSVHRPTPRSQPPLPKRPPMQREYQEHHSKPKVMTKQPLASSREQMKRPPPKAPARGTSADQRPKVKPKRQLQDEDPDDADAINMIRNMFRYNPNKFRDDDDVSDMEANFDDIQREEKRSARIARKEDEEELRRIEEEEKRERMRLAKKRKMGH